MREKCRGSDRSGFDRIFRTKNRRFLEKVRISGISRGKLEEKISNRTKNSGRVWKNYTICIVNLTAAKEGQYLGCNHGSTTIADPIDEIAARRGRERRLSAPGTPHATIALNGFHSCAAGLGRAA